MGHTRIDKANGMFPITQFKREIQSHIHSISHPQLYSFLHNLRAVDARFRLKSHLIGRHDFLIMGKSGDASGPIAASFSLTAV
jgi:hypothetical protein